MPQIDFDLYLISDRRQTGGRPLPDVIREAGRGGISTVQFREKDLSLRAQLQLAQEIQKVTRSQGMKLFVNDRVDLLLAIDADGIHLPSSSLPVRVVRKLVGETKWIAVSCHSIEETQKAEADGADFVVLGPLFDTPSKRRYGPPLGPDALQKAKRAISIPLFAIGGIKSNRLKEVFDAGADGIAVVSAIMSADNTQKASETFLSDIKKFKSR